MSRKLGIIGCGKMGKAFITGFIKSKKYPVDLISVFTPSKVSQDWARSHGCSVLSSKEELVNSQDVILVLVRPNIIAHVMKEIAPYVGDSKLVVSGATGITLSFIESHLKPVTRACRVMTNLNIQLCLGTSGIARGSKCTDSDVDYLTETMNMLGYCVELPEHQFDVFSSLAGSGPAFVYQFMESLVEGAAFNHFPRKLATEIAVNMVRGAAENAKESLEVLSLQQLRDAVCTPNGSTIQGVRALERGGIRSAVISTIDAAVQRNREISKEINN